MRIFLREWMTRLPDFGQVVKRFPVAVGIMAIVTLYFIVFKIENHNDSMLFLMLGLTLSAYLAMMQTLWAEARGRRLNWLLQIVMAIALAGLFYFAEILHVNVWMIIGAVLLLIGNSVRFGRGRDDLHIWDFTHKIWSAAGFSAVGSGIYLIGVLAIMTALKSLFGLDIEGVLERLLLPIGFAFLAPLYWLSNIPPVDEAAAYLQDDPSFVSKAVAFLGTWILSPLTLIYALILLAYGLKILVQMDLPKGEIAALTLPFLLIGTLTWLLLEPPFIQKNGLAKLFRKSWFAVSIPAAIMLTISVSVRIGEYGLTLERILLILASFWILTLAAWFILAPKARRDIRIIPALAAVLLLIAAPTAYHLSVSSQASRFENNLTKAGVLQADGTIIPAQITDKAAAGKAKGALRYLMRHDAKPRVEKILQNSGLKFDDSNIYAQTDYLMKSLGLNDVTEASSAHSIIGENFAEFRRGKTPFNIQGFDRFHGSYNLSTNSNRTLINANGFILRLAEGQLTINDEAYSYDIHNWLKALETDQDRLIVDEPHLRIVDTDTHKVELVFKSITRQKHDETYSFSANFYVFTSGFDIAETP